VAVVEVGRGRVEAELHAQRAAALREALRKRPLRQGFDGVARQGRGRSGELRFASLPDRAANISTADRIA
jgi:hypothetical protein